MWRHKPVFLCLFTETLYLSLGISAKLQLELEELKRKIELSNVNNENAKEKLGNSSFILIFFQFVIFVELEKQTLKAALEDEKAAIVAEKNQVEKEKRDLEKKIESLEAERLDQVQNSEKEGGKLNSNINRLTKIITEKTEELGVNEFLLF
jgi:hypothetical protein